MDAVSLQTQGIGATHASGTKTSRDLSSQDFFKLLITEMQQQDPLKPNDTSQLVQQVSQIRQMDLSTKLDSTLNSFAAQQRVGGASGMIGRYVSGTVTSGNGTASANVQGIVIGVSFNDSGDAILQLHNGGKIAVKDVKDIALVDPQTGNPLIPGATTPTPTTPANPGSATPTLPATPTTRPAAAA